MDQIKIGKFIADCRRKKKLTQEQFAERIGVNNRSISRWENGKCMPDLSLYDSICKELDITINELLEGEHIKKESYQNVFEKNVINMVENIDKKNKKYNIMSYTIFFILIVFISWFIGCVLYQNIEFKQSYKETKIFIEKEYSFDEKYLIINSYDTGSIKYLILNTKQDDEEYGIIFISFYKTPEDIYQGISNQNNDLTNRYYQNRISLTTSKIKENYKVYYTTENFSKIRKANDEEISKIIKKSNLLYETN